jgi:hypothetical protein
MMKRSSENNGAYGMVDEIAEVVFEVPLDISLSFDALWHDVRMTT